MLPIERDVKKYIMVVSAKVLAISSSTNATPIEVTTGTHGFVTGDKVTINGHATNTAANGTWTITRVSATKFTLDGSVGNGIGGATGVVASFIEPLHVKDYRHLLVSFASDGGGTADATIKCCGSIQETVPDFAAPRSVANNFEFVMMVDKQSSGSGLPGDTGVVFGGADDYLQFEVNVNGLNFLGFLPTAGTVGTYTIKAMILNP